MKDRLILIVSLASGVVAAVLAYLYIGSATQALEEVEPPKKVRVLFVKKDLAADELIDPETHLRVQEIVEEEMPALARGAVKEEESYAVQGRPVAIPVPAGLPLMYAHLTEVRDVELPPGTRAMAINVDGTSLMGGLLLPGDRVDIFVTRPDDRPAPMPPRAASADESQSEVFQAQALAAWQARESSGPEFVTERVLESIRVIAVGSRLSGSRQAQLFGMASGGSGGRTVTIEVTEDQALGLLAVQAGQQSKLTLLLRPDEGSGESRNGFLIRE